MQVHASRPRPSRMFGELHRRSSCRQHSRAATLAPRMLDELSSSRAHELLMASISSQSVPRARPCSPKGTPRGAAAAAGTAPHPRMMRVAPTTVHKDGLRASLLRACPLPSRVHARRLPFCHRCFVSHSKYADEAVSVEALVVKIVPPTSTVTRSPAPGRAEVGPVSEVSSGAERLRCGRHRCVPACARAWRPRDADRRKASATRSSTIYSRQRGRCSAASRRASN